MNKKSTFFNGILKEEVYVEQPLGYIYIYIYIYIPLDNKLIFAHYHKSIVTTTDLSVRN